jgi:hypothetical protein
MIETIKKASVNVIGASNPLDVQFGTIVDDDLTIQIDQKSILPREFFIVPEQMTRYVVDLTHNHTYSEGTTINSLGALVIREGLNKGDSVILLRIEQGSRFLILDKVVK